MAHLHRRGACVHGAGPAVDKHEGGSGVGAAVGREAEVLQLAATGLDNEGIAAVLVLSVRTVERHLQNAYTKLGVQGKAARAAAVARFLAPA